ncbi:MAG TPA: hypothetical protein VFA26_01120 [Gemmataceae bacterium]|nr:hypothetical protein [Gemmataceae bacterium]
MTTPRPLSDDEREDLTAYLDGELDEQSARELEAKLGRDPNTRAEAEALKRTWDLLDYLPQPEPSPSFTQRTLSRISTLRPAAKTGPVARRRLWPMALAWAAGILLAAAGGYAGSTFLSGRDRDDEELVRDLRVIENKRLYEQADDLNFLRQLDHPDLFGDDGLGS